MRKLLLSLVLLPFLALASDNPAKPTVGGTGVSNPINSTLSLPDNNPLMLETTDTTDVILPTSGTLATTDEVDALNFQGVYGKGVSPNQGDVILNVNNSNPLRTITTGTSGTQNHLEFFNDTNASVNWGPSYTGLNSSSTKVTYASMPTYIFDDTAGSESATWKLFVRSYGINTLAYFLDGVNQAATIYWPAHILNGAQTYQTTQLVTGDITYGINFLPGYLLLSDDVANHNITIPATYSSTNADDSFTAQTQSTNTLTLIPSGGTTINGSSSSLVIPTSTRATMQLVNPSTHAWLYTQEKAIAGDGEVTVTDDNSTNATMYPLWVSANSGLQPTYVSSTNIQWNPSTSALKIIDGLGDYTTVDALSTIFSLDDGEGFRPTYTQYGTIASGSLFQAGILDSVRYGYDLYDSVTPMYVYYTDPYGEVGPSTAIHFQYYIILDNVAANQLLATDSNKQIVSAGALPTVASGAYTPTISCISNCTSPTLIKAYYQTVNTGTGAAQQFNVRFSFQATNTSVALRVDCPAPNNAFTAAAEAAGVGTVNRSSAPSVGDGFINDVDSQSGFAGVVVTASVSVSAINYTANVEGLCQQQ